MRRSGLSEPPSTLRATGDADKEQRVQAFVEIRMYLCLTERRGVRESSCLARGYCVHVCRGKGVCVSIINKMCISLPKKFVRGVVCLKL